MKVIRKQGKKDRKRLDLHMQTFELEFRREAQFLRNMNHPHIIKMVNCKVGEEDERPKSGESRKSNRSNNSSGGEEQDQSRNANEVEQFSKYIILEYADNGDLFDYVISI
jgi:serine/threonine protein kinase